MVVVWVGDTGESVAVTVYEGVLKGMRGSSQGADRAGAWAVADGGRGRGWGGVQWGTSNEEWGVVLGASEPGRLLRTKSPGP